MHAYWASHIVSGTKISKAETYANFQKKQKKYIVYTTLLNTLKNTNILKGYKL